MFIRSPHWHEAKKSSLSQLPLVITNLIETFFLTENDLLNLIVSTVIPTRLTGNLDRFFAHTINGQAFFQPRTFGNLIFVEQTPAFTAQLSARSHYTVSSDDVYYLTTSENPAGLIPNNGRRPPGAEDDEKHYEFIYRLIEREYVAKTCDLLINFKKLFPSLASYVREKYSHGHGRSLTICKNIPRHILETAAQNAEERRMIEYTLFHIKIAAKAKKDILAKKAYCGGYPKFPIGYMWETWEEFVKSQGITYQRQLDSLINLFSNQIGANLQFVCTELRILLFGREHENFLLIWDDLITTFLKYQPSDPIVKLEMAKVGTPMSLFIDFNMVRTSGPFFWTTTQSVNRRNEVNKALMVEGNSEYTPDFKRHTVMPACF